MLLSCAAPTRMRSTKFPANCRPSRSVYKQTHTHTGTASGTLEQPRKAAKQTATPNWAGVGLVVAAQRQSRAEQERKICKSSSWCHKPATGSAPPPLHPSPSLSAPSCTLSLCYLHFVLPAFLLPSPSRAPACSPARAECQRQPFGYLPLLGSGSATLLLGSATRALCTSRQLATARTLTRTCLLARLSIEHAPHTRPRPDLIWVEQQKNLMNIWIWIWVLYECECGNVNEVPPVTVCYFELSRFALAKCAISAARNVCEMNWEIAWPNKEEEEAKKRRKRKRKEEKKKSKWFERFESAVRVYESNQHCQLQQPKKVKTTIDRTVKYRKDSVIDLCIDG